MFFLILIYNKNIMNPFGQSADLVVFKRKKTSETFEQTPTKKVR